MKRILILATAAILAACGGGNVHAQNLTQATLETQVHFGTGTVDIEHARMVDLDPSNSVIVDANGVTHQGSFAYVSAFSGSKAFPKYIQEYPGARRYWNASMFNISCVNGNTSRLSWINGGTTDLADGCSLQIQVFNWARNN
ncbi:MAG: hypothetical protein JO253_03185 [Alphaproteobacteria bacterium]|nr:hypothetical protein [Alphaproteobacteria bacterium]